jgi:glutamyl-tRNA reductase
MPETLHRLKGEVGIPEVALLSTCNRFEAYFQAPDVCAARSALFQFLRRSPGQAVSGPLLYEFAEAQVARHLFRVASGLDSMIVGEHEVLGQVKQAYCAAQAAGTTGKLLNVLFQRSLYIGKRVRTETGLCRGVGSIGSLAATLAERIFGKPEEIRVMILGAGEMAELTARHLFAHKVRSIMVSNRTYERATALAWRFGGVALHLEEGMREMVHADVVICSTAAPHAVIHPEPVREMMTRRGGRPLFFIDIALPRDVHPQVREIPGVHLYDLDNLQAIVDEHIARRRDEIGAAEQIIEEKTEEFRCWLGDFRAGRLHALRHWNRETGYSTPDPGTCAEFEKR